MSDVGGERTLDFLIPAGTLAAEEFVCQWSPGAEADGRRSAEQSNRDKVGADDDLALFTTQRALVTADKRSAVLDDCDALLPVG